MRDAVVNESRRVVDGRRPNGFLAASAAEPGEEADGVELKLQLIEYKNIDAADAL